MDSAHTHHATTQDVMLDIEAELAYWRRCYETQGFHRSGWKFDAYEPTLKFGYDSFLLHYRSPLEPLLPALKVRYESHVPATQRLEWSRGQTIIRQTWQRMQPG